MLVAVEQEQRERFGPGGGIYRILMRAEETSGRHFGVEAIEPPGGGPPLHTHANEDEHFTVVEGEMTFYIDGRVETVAAGGSAFVPRGVPHCFKNGAAPTRRHSAIAFLAHCGSVSRIKSERTPLSPPMMTQSGEQPSMSNCPNGPRAGS